MSNKTHYYCDICKKEFEQNELTKIRIEGAEYSKIFKRLWNSFDVCEICGLKVGLEKTNPVNPCEHQKTTAEQLYDIVAQIVYENQRG